jgi:extracellular matrix regulatory protein A
LLTADIYATKGTIPMTHKLVNVGFGNSVVSRRVVAIISPNAAPMKRLRDEARQDKRLIDATQGRKTRSIIITDSNHIILSAIQSETIAQRFSPDITLTKEEIKDDNDEG